jgi:adenosylcobinamide-phosphate synthase
MMRCAAPHWHRLLALLYGAVLVVGGVMVVSLIGIAVSPAAIPPLPWYWLAEASVLRPPSPSAVWSRPRSGACGAGRRELERARQLLSWHLVSRDTATLTPSQVAAATVESVAENASDGIIAPLVFYALGVCQPPWPIVSSIRRMRCWAIVIQNVNG